MLEIDIVEKNVKCKLIKINESRNKNFYSKNNF